MTKCTHFIFFSTFFLYSLIFFITFAYAKTVPALGVLSNIRGEVKAGYYGKLVKSFNGKMLWERYHVNTEEKSSATIFLKDGSEIRLFAKSNLKIGVKKDLTKRWVRYRIFLISGSLWAVFRRGEYPVEVFGKGLQIFVSNATLRFTKKRDRHSISVNSGILKVFNRISTVKLISGQRLYEVQKKDFLPQKISQIPNKLKMWIEQDNLALNNKNPLNVNLFIQVIRSENGKIINRPGPIFLRSSYYNIISPDSIRLNTEGETKTNLKVKAPHKIDRTFEGSVILQALMDQNGFDDVQDGSLKVKFILP